MRKIALSCAGLAMLVLVLPAPPAQALDLKTFVASFGNSGAACTRADPCLDFDRAVSQTADGGEVNCLDSGPVGGGTITRSVTIDCGGTSATALPLVPGTVFTVNGAGIVVRFRNLTLDGAGATLGIDFQNGAALFVEKCVIMNFKTDPALGIRFQPSAVGSQLVVTDTTIDNNGIVTSGVGGGIRVAPAGGTAGVVLNRLRLGFNATAMVLDGAIAAVMRDSVVNSSNINGILVSDAVFVLERSSIVNNKFASVRTSGNALVRIGDSTLAGNDFGVLTGFGGMAQSFKDNHIAGNNHDLAPVAAFPGPGGPLQ